MSLPALFPTGGDHPPPPEHVVIDMPVVVSEGVPVPTTPPPAVVPHVVVCILVEAGDHHDVASARSSTRWPLVGKVVKGLWLAYMALVVPAMAVAALIWGVSPYLQLMVFFAGVLTAALFLTGAVEEPDDEQAAAGARREVKTKGHQESA